MKKRKEREKVKLKLGITQIIVIAIIIIIMIIPKAAVDNFKYNPVRDQNTKTCFQTEYLFSAWMPMLQSVTEEEEDDDHDELRLCCFITVPQRISFVTLRPCL